MKQHFSKSIRNVSAIFVVACLAMMLDDARSQDVRTSKRIGERFHRSPTSRTSAAPTNAAPTNAAPTKTARPQDDAAQDDTSNGDSSSDDSAADGTAAPPRQGVDDTHPVIIAVRESNPTTPAELIDAVETMLNLGRPDEAQRYLDLLIPAGLDDAAMYELQKQKGTAFFLHLYRSKELAPESNAFARLVLEAAYAMSRDPNRMRGIVQALNAPTDGARENALHELKALGESAVEPLIEVLLDSSRSDEHKTIARALLRLETAAIEPLLGALRSTNETVRRAAMEVLARQKVFRAAPAMVFASVSPQSSDLEQRIAREALIELYGVAPTEDEARIFLRDELDAFLNGALPGKLGFDNTITMWIWDVDANASVEIEVPPRLGSLLIASDLAADLYLLAPDNFEVQRLYLSTLIETDQRSLGLDVSMSGTESVAVAMEFGTERVEEVLKDAIADHRPVTAAAAVEILGIIGDETLLESSDGRPRLLIDALRHGDRRVRFAACMAILAIDPQTAYPGSSYFIDALVYFLRSAGERRVLIGHTQLAQARTMLAALNEIGYVGETANRGREVFLKAASHPDYEIVLISNFVSSPEANELIQQMRRDPRTSKLPIGLLAVQEALPRARRIAEGDPLTLAIPWPYESEAVQLTAQELRTTLGLEFVDASQRLVQANAALDGLLSLMARSDALPFYDIRSHETQIIEALYTPQLTAKLASLLGMSGSPRAQLELVNLASQPLIPVASRQAAVDAFRAAVDARGVLLTSTDVLRQYDRYNQSVDLDRDTQLVLGAVLDVLESKHRNASGNGD